MNGPGIEGGDRTDYIGESERGNSEGVGQDLPALAEQLHRFRASLHSGETRSPATAPVQEHPQPEHEEVEEPENEGELGHSVSLAATLGAGQPVQLTPDRLNTGPGKECQRSPYSEPPGSGKLSHPGRPS